MACCAAVPVTISGCPQDAQIVLPGAFVAPQWLHVMIFSSTHHDCNTASFYARYVCRLDDAIGHERRCHNSPIRAFRQCRGKPACCKSSKMVGFAVITRPFGHFGRVMASRIATTRASGRFGRVVARIAMNAALGIGVVNSSGHRPRMTVKNGRETGKQQTHAPRNSRRTSIKLPDNTIAALSSVRLYRYCRRTQPHTEAADETHN